MLLPLDYRLRRANDGSASLHSHSDLFRTLHKCDSPHLDHSFERFPHSSDRYRHRHSRFPRYLRRNQYVTSLVLLKKLRLIPFLYAALLQLSKIDPNEIKSAVLDRRSTVLLSASRAEASQHDGLDAREKGLDIEDPGIDTLRGTAGAIGSIHRAISMRRGMSRASSRADSGFDPSEVVRRRNGGGVRNGAPGALGSGPQEMGMTSLARHQLYDEPMPYDANDKISLHSGGQPSPGLLPNPPRSATLKFAEEDRIHQCESY
jgi:hypothetical protein